MYIYIYMLKISKNIVLEEMKNSFVWNTKDLE
jgi:hypothetical protein